MSIMIYLNNDNFKVMPRGEHFKKENPRIHQVSFKVNETELKQLNQIASNAGIPVAQWLRNCITGEFNENKKPQATQKVKLVEKPKPKVEKVSKAKKPKDYGNDSKTEQMSLF